MNTRKFSVCVFCGSRPGARAAYTTAAREIGATIAKRGWRLVYGAGDIGLMGSVAQQTIAAGGEVFGVIPEHLLNREIAERHNSPFVVTENMHERKKVMFMNCDALVVLPGGAGSLDEFFEVLTWRQIGLHEKPIFLLNIDGYWDKLIELIDHIIDQGFADESLKSYFETVDDTAQMTTALDAAQIAQNQ